MIGGGDCDDDGIIFNVIAIKYSICLLPAMVLWCICLTACGQNDFIAVANQRDVQRQKIQNLITWKIKNSDLHIQYCILYRCIIKFCMYIYTYIYINVIYIYICICILICYTSIIITHPSACRSSHSFWPNFRSCPLAHAQRIPFFLRSIAKTMALRSRLWELGVWKTKNTCWGSFMSRRKYTNPEYEHLG